MRKKFLSLCALCLCGLPAVFLLAPLAEAQTTVVTGTVTDANGIPYVGGQLTAQLVLAGGGVTGQPVVTVSNAQQCRSAGQGSAPCKIPFTATVGPVTLDSTGSFNLALQDNTLVTPVATQWAFNVTISPAVAPPLGTGPQSCSATLTITGASQSVTGLATCPALSRGGSGIQTFNVKDPAFGAFGDTTVVSVSGVTNPSGTQLHCTQCSFTPADAGNGKQIFLHTSLGASGLVQTTITGFVSSTDVTLQAMNLTSGTGILVYGHDDTTAIRAAGVAMIAAITGNGQQQFLNKTTTKNPNLYFPTGNYLVCNLSTPLVNVTTSNLGGWSITGDGQNKSSVSLCDVPTFTGDTKGQIVHTANTTVGYIEHMTFSGSSSAAQNQIILKLNGVTVNDVGVTGFGLNSNGGGNTIALNCSGACIVLRSYIAVNSIGAQFQSGNTELHETTISNNWINANIAGINGAPFAAGFRMIGGLIDECGNVTVACVQVTTSKDVWFIGTSIFSPAGGVSGLPAMSVDGTSSVHLMGGEMGPFTLSNSQGGIQIAAGGNVVSEDVTYYAVKNGVAGSKCIDNAGTFSDLGGNKCLDIVSIASSPTGATEAGTVVTLTTNAGLNHGLTTANIGQPITVAGVGVGGYNGTFTITGVPSTSTVTYTAGAGLGNSGSGTFTVNTFFNGAYNGTAPASALTHGTVNFTEGAVNLAASNIGVWTPDQDIQITRIQATNTAGNVTCATPLVLKFSNGIASQDTTLTLTSGQAAWDTGVLTGKALAGGVQATLSQTAAGACATPPVNLNITIIWSSLGTP